MATTFTSPHHPQTKIGFAPETASSSASTSEGSHRGALTTFLGDLIEDVAQNPLQAAEFAKHDMFKEHIIAMSTSYFALILLLIGLSIPLLGYLMRTLVPY